MKKVIFPVVVALAMTFVSCGNKSATNANGVDSLENAMELIDEQSTAVADELKEALDANNAEGVQSTFEKISAKYQELVEAGKLEEAKAYASKVQEFINTNADKISAVTSGNTTVTELINTVKNLPTSAETTAEEAAAAVKSDVKNAAETAVEGVKDAANEKVNEAKTAVEEKATETVNNAKDKANKAVEDANNKATNALNKAADKLKIK